MKRWWYLLEKRMRSKQKEIYMYIKSSWDLDEETMRSTWKDHAFTYRDKDLHKEIIRSTFKRSWDINEDNMRSKWRDKEI